jgi:hypothetical protein
MSKHNVCCIDRWFTGSDRDQVTEGFSKPMADKEAPAKPVVRHTPLTIDELRQMVREDIEEQRKIADSFRRKMH